MGWLILPMSPENTIFPVYIDSPLASKATTIFCGDLRGYLDEEALALVKNGVDMFSFPGLRLTAASGRR